MIIWLGLGIKSDLNSPSAVRKRHFHEDIHNKLMQAYDAVPTWWYIATLLINGMAAGTLDKSRKTVHGSTLKSRPLRHYTSSSCAGNDHGSTNSSLAYAIGCGGCSGILGPNRLYNSDQ